MAIPVQYAQFKAAGIYRLVYDRSTVLNQDAEILRLVVGYSEKGPFNIPTYVKSVSEFKALYGDISKKLEKRGVYFHRMAIQALASGPILCLNLKPFNEDNTVTVSGISTAAANDETATYIKSVPVPVTDIYDTTRFWELSADQLTKVDFGDATFKPYIAISATDSNINSASYFIRKAASKKVAAYDMTVADWYKSTGDEIPEYLDKYLNANLKDFFAEIYVFQGEFKKEQVLASDSLKNYFDVDGDGELKLKPVVYNAFGDPIDTLDALFAEETSGPIAHYIGCLIPFFVDKMGRYQSLDILFNQDIDNHHLMMNMNADLLEDDVNVTNIYLGGSNLLTEEFIESILASDKNDPVTTTLLGNSKSPITWVKLEPTTDEYADEDEDEAKSVYDESLSFIAFDEYTKQEATDEEGNGIIVYATDAKPAVPDKDGRMVRAEDFAFGLLSEGEAIVSTEKNADGTPVMAFIVSLVAEDEFETATDDAGKETKVLKSTTYKVQFSNDPFIVSDNSYLVRFDNGLNQEIGVMKPTFLAGYDYSNFAKPENTSMMAKLRWQDQILDVLNDVGIRTALLNRSEIDFRYIVDTFESFVDSGLKDKLSYLAKEKQSAFAILNFPAVKTFVKCEYASFTDSRGIFNVQYVVDGSNKRKASSLRFSLPGEPEGASFCAFYTPLKFTDGYIDSVIPSAALVSNLFMEKYMSRQPYYIIAGPNYGAMSASGLLGPDYHYSKDELNIIEPYGVNCMVYRPSFGTFINANQTAKQTPKSALSSVNVRELVIYLQDEIEKVLQAYQWEFNNAVTRQAIKDRADLICERAKQNGGIIEYLNVMDESNNTPEIIDNEMAVLATHIEPGRGMGKMIHELTIYRTGQLRATIMD